ncbi:MAG TPA: diguanylate cyclase, partial [Myxococcales bacterium]|nr:diguanylate cyclase [Myxococcales bacterium]
SASREQLVVLGPSLPRPAAAARRIRERAPQALVLQAQQRPGKAAHADGVLPLPLSPADLRARLPELWELRALRRAGEQARPPRPEEALLDPLTHFYAFRPFKEVLAAEVRRAGRHGFPLALAVVAFDPPAQAAARALRGPLFGALALAVRRSLRDTDYPVQYGPDQVVALMPHADLPGALVTCQRICERVAKSTLTHGQRVLRPTASAGVASVAAPSGGGEPTLEELLARAERALERAAAAGGNRVEQDPGS